jgi:hypothetical protein
VKAMRNFSSSSSTTESKTYKNESRNETEINSVDFRGTKSSSCDENESDYDENGVLRNQIGCDDDDDMLLDLTHESTSILYTQLPMKAERKEMITTKNTNEQPVNSKTAKKTKQMVRLEDYNLDQTQQLLVVPK